MSSIVVVLLPGWPSAAASYFLGWRGAGPAMCRAHRRDGPPRTKGGPLSDQAGRFLGQLDQDQAQLVSVIGAVGCVVVLVVHGRFLPVWPLRGGEHAVNPHREHQRPRFRWEVRQGENLSRAYLLLTRPTEASRGIDLSC